MRIRRLIFFGYGPLLGNLAMWVTVYFLLGIEALLILSTSYFLVAACYGFTALPIRVLMQSRRKAPPDVWHETHRILWKAEAITMLGGAAIGVAIAFLLNALGHSALMTATLLILSGLPARYSGPLRAYSWFRPFYHNCRTFSGAVLVFLAIYIFNDIYAAAIAIALREWLAVLIIAFSRSPVLMGGKTSKKRANKSIKPPRLRDFARTAPLSSNKRMFYLIGKYGLAMIFGPLGIILAKTGRFAINDDKLKSPFLLSVTIAVISMVGCAIMVAIYVDQRLLLLTAFLFRISASAINACVWQMVRKATYRRPQSRP